MTDGKKAIKTQKAELTPKSDQNPATVPVDDSARLREIRKLVEANNHSTLDENLIICQIYMESRFDAHAGASHDAKGLFQMQLGGVQQVYKYRKQKERGGRMPSDAQTKQAFSDGAAMHDSPEIFDEATNIQLGTEYMQYCMQYWLDRSSSIEDAYKAYRGVDNGIYYKKISAAATKLAADPDSMQVLRDMVTTK